MFGNYIIKIQKIWKKSNISSLFKFAVLWCSHQKERKILKNEVRDVQKLDGAAENGSLQVSDLIDQR
jgi:hypothetical protein